MAEGRRKLEWSQTADLMALLFNGLFHPAEPRFARDFNPTLDPEPDDEPLKVPLSFLRTVFVENRNG